MRRELELLREKMRETGVDACLIPTSDFHGSEYVGDYFKCREYISGFTGSAGTLVVTLDEAGLWTDGRYFLQAAKQFFQVGTGWQEPVNGRFQLCLIAGAVLRSLMFNIALALVLSWDDDGQTVFFAKPVRSAADIVITPLVGMIVLVIRKADRIENQVVMNMIFVYVGGKYKFILAAQDFFCKLHADLMGLFRCDLPRLKGLDQVAAQVRSLVDGVAAGPCKFNVGAAKGGHRQLPIRLVWIADIVNGRFQR